MSIVIADRVQLAALEAVIARGQRTFIEVGSALMTIRDERLYRATNDTFEDYCRERWGWTRQRAHQLIEASEVAAFIPLSTTVDIPSERQARELVPLLREAPEQVEEAWAEAVERSEGKPTAAVVHEVVAERRAPSSPPSSRMAVHYMSETPEWYTPRHIVERVVRALGSIDLDPCSNPGEPNVPAARHFTAEDDGLEQGWRGRVYMNPPYGDIIPNWVDKLALEYQSGNVTEAVALVPARTDTAWFHRLPASHLCLIAGRLAFSASETKAPFPSVAAYVGRDPSGFVAAFADAGLLFRRLEADEMAAAA